MRVLIDIHVFLWWVLETPRLTGTMREIIADGSNDVLFRGIPILTADPLIARYDVDVVR